MNIAIQKEAHEYQKALDFIMAAEYKYICKNYTLGIKSICHFCEELNFPVFLKRLFQVIADANIEYYFGDWTLMSFSDVLYVRTRLLKRGQDRVIDFSFMKVDFEYAIICSIDPYDGRIFFRREFCGSDQIQVDIEWNFICQFEPYDTCKYEFHKWITYTQQKYLNMFTIPLIN